MVLRREKKMQVGNWTWGWMEPPIGTISFVLLVLQFSRNQLENIWLPPGANLYSYGPM